MFGLLLIDEGNLEVIIIRQYLKNDSRSRRPLSPKQRKERSRPLTY